jgi:hypothetical protein
MSDFQSQVNVVPAPAVAGDFASTNPRSSVINGAGGFVADTGGGVVGLFAWADTATNTKVTNAGTGAPTGFVGRQEQGLITTYLSASGVTIPAGMPVTLFNGGDFWVTNNNASAASAVGNKVFASNTTGQIRFAAAGATVAGYTETDFYAASVGAVGELVKITSTPVPVAHAGV